jgi:acyl carrier protein
MTIDSAGMHAARTLVAKALSVSEDQVAPETEMYKLPAWDSFGQLIVILAIEEEVGARIDDEATFKQLTSMGGIAAYLAAVIARS